MSALRAAFAMQATACAGLGSPFMGQLLGGLAEAWPEGTALDHACAAFTGDIGPGGHSLPLRIAGGLHALVLRGDDPALVAAYPPHIVADARLLRAVTAALATHSEFMIDWIARPPQTNEIRRSAALIPAAHWIAARHALPFVTSELGASGGLNLGWDRYALAPDGFAPLGPADPALTLTPDWRGAPPPCAVPVRVAARAGVDLTPLDARKPDDALRLAAYLWPDQPDRLTLTRAAMAAQTDWPEAGDAIDWLETRLRSPHAGHVHLIYHTIAWQYFPAAAQYRGTALIETAGQAATVHAPLAWLRLENDGASDPGAALTLRLWPGDLRITLGRADFHGRWIDWTAPTR